MVRVGWRSCQEQQELWLWFCKNYHKKRGVEFKQTTAQHTDFTTNLNLWAKDHNRFFVHNNPINFVDPLGLWRSHPTYGNWGGEGWSGGRLGHQPPVDSLDLCFKEHDICYRNRRCSGDTKTCDDQLSKCVLGLSKILGRGLTRQKIQYGQGFTETYLWVGL